jgi:SAM-dependent methyltransferase
VSGPLEGPERDAARERVRSLGRASAARGEPTAWFDRVYKDAGGDPTLVPWADLRPHPALAELLAAPGATDGVRRALVVGCGLGHDAEAVVAAGVDDVLAFDVSPEAVAWARRLHPESRVRYEVADLLAPPPSWRGAFDLVVESTTLQALPPDARAGAFRAIADALAPRGRLFLATRVREEGEVVEGPPWPPTLAEVERGFSGLAWERGPVVGVDPGERRGNASTRGLPSTPSSAFGRLDRSGQAGSAGRAMKPFDSREPRRSLGSPSLRADLEGSELG